MSGSHLVQVFRINELSASVLLSQLEEESTIRNVREEIYHTYKNILEDIELAEYMTTQKSIPKFLQIIMHTI